MSGPGTLARDGSVAKDEIGARSIAEANTVVSAFVRRVRSDPRTTAFAYKRLGEWHSVSYRALASDVLTACAILRQLGLERGDVIALIGESTHYFLQLDLAAQLLGMPVVTTLPTATVRDIEMIFDDSEPRLVVAATEDDLELLPRTDAKAGPGRTTIVLEAGHRIDQDSGVLYLSDLTSEACTVGDVEELGALASAVAGDHPQFVFYEPLPDADQVRSFALSQADLVSAWREFVSVCGGIGPADRVVVDLSYGCIRGRAFALVLPMLTGCIPHFPESIHAVREARLEVRPTIEIGTPRLLKSQAIRVEVGIAESTWSKRHGFQAGMAARRKGKEGGLAVVGTWVGAALAVRPVLNAIGWSRLRLFILGESPVPPGVLDFWRLFGITFVQIYGPPEAAGVAAIVNDASTGAPGLVPLSTSELVLSTDGEILLGGPVVSTGGREPTGSSRPQPPPPVRTGDAAVAAGSDRVQYRGRLADVLTLRSGRVLYPLEAETLIEGSPYFATAVLVANPHGGLGVVVEVEVDAISEWARRERIHSSSLRDLLGRDEALELLRNEMGAANGRLTEATYPVVSEFRLMGPGVTLTIECSSATGEAGRRRNPQWLAEAAGSTHQLGGQS